MPVEGLLGRLREGDPPPEEKEKLLVAIDAIRFHPKPPLGACVLVAGEYYRVMYSRETHLRKLLPSPGTLEYYLEDMTRDGLPAPVVTFNTRGEADAWLNNQPEPPAHAFILIAGEYHLAVYHYRVNLRAIYPIPLGGKPVQKSKTED